MNEINPRIGYQLGEMDTEIIERSVIGIEWATISSIYKDVLLRQIQNLLLFVSSGFVLLMISLNCYTIQAPQFTGRLLLLLFVIIGVATFSCLAGLERDTILSRMTGSDPGKFNSGFYLKIAAYGGLPALSLLASEFPSISNFLLSWVEPTLEALK